MPDTDTRALAAQRVAPLCLLVGLGGALLLLHDGAAGLNLGWERQFGPLLAVLYLGTATLLWWRPRWLDAVMGTTLACTGAYFLGVIQEAARLDTPEGLYAVGANAQFMPLIYVGAFVTLRRGAVWLSGALYLTLVALYGALYLAGPDEGLFTELSTHTWTVLLLVHPACILALQHITALRGRLGRAEQEAHAGKERFLAMLSHEIRSPLQTMLGSIDLLALRLHDEPAQRAIDRLRRSATQLEAHLRDVTEYTRLENPEWQLHEEDTDLGALIRDVCDQLAPLAEHKRLSLRCEVADAHAGPLSLQRVDPVRLRQILGNLITNAIKYTPDGTVCVRAALVGRAQGQSDLRLEVEDSGIGIDPAELHRIFEPHVRLEAPGNERVAGSGLGLAVVQRLVQRLGGRILVDSLPGQGSRFVLTLPLPPAPPRRQSNPAVT